MTGLHTRLTKTETLVERLLWRAYYQPEQHAYTFLRQNSNGSNTLSYAQLDTAARAVATLLQEQKTRGEPVLLLLQPGLDYITSFFGCLYAGAIAVPAYPPFSSRMLPRIQSIMRDTQSRVVLTTSDTLMDIKRSQVDISGLEPIYWITTDTLDDHQASIWQEPTISGDTTAFLQYTSGSTASPRGVMVSHANLIHNLELLCEHCEQTPASHLVSWVPPYHDLGLIAGILLPFYVGFPATLLPPVTFLQRPLRWLQAISDTKATMSIAPNFAYELCAQKITPEQKAALDLSNWEIAGNGGEPLRPETLERFSSAFSSCGFRYEAFFPGYGMAESTLIMATGTKGKPTVVRTFQKSALEQHSAVPVPADHQEAHAIVGYERLVAQHRILIVAPETLTECPTGQVGEIWLAGPIVASGYWKNPAETSRTFQGYLSAPIRPANEALASSFAQAGRKEREIHHVKKHLE